MPRFRFIQICINVMLLFANAVVAPAHAAPYKIEQLASGLDLPWSIAKLPSGKLLITEKSGQLNRLDQSGATSIISGVPDVYFASQGGLLDVVLHPDFESNQLVYLSYASGDVDGNRTTVMRARLTEDSLTNGEVILTVNPAKSAAAHYGGRLAFLPDNTLLISVGEGFQFREQAQSLSSELGKVLRVNDDGTPASDNPYPKHAPRVFSYGHRNPQGLTVDAQTGEIFMHEHGPKGGDELNRIKPGTNYGWPAITYGLDYSGAIISPYTEADGMAQPLVYWVPSIGPSGLAVYRGDQFPQWDGDFFVGALIDQQIIRLNYENGEITDQERVFTEINERIRDIRVFDDGAFYIATDEGNIYRISNPDSD